MKNRNQSFINIVALIFIIVIGIFVYFAVTNDEGGLNLNSSSIKNRVSYSYTTKSVNDKESVDIEYNRETGSANIVTSIVVNYRYFDTIGEILVLFASAAAVGLLAIGRKRKIYREASPISKTVIPIISFITIIVGATIVLHGHLTPGGGFPGGALIASGIILLMLINPKPFSNKPFLIIESIAGVSILLLGFVGLWLGGSFLNNWLSSGVIGDLISAGISPLIYILIGIKVASEITSIGSYFLGKDNKESE